MVRLSVNINKIATIRNARGGDVPNVLEAAINCERYGAEGITVHPRPDERHIRYQDAREIKKAIKTEFNIEGYPSEEFLQLVEEVLPHQVTLVPDSPDVLTSNAGWDTIKNKEELIKIISRLKSKGIRTSIFIETDVEMIKAAAETGTDRIELYTESYAVNFKKNKEEAIAPFVKAAIAAKEVGLEINAGHDLDSENLHYFAKNIPALAEVSIGHALISEALYMGLENTIQYYLRQLEK
jgi:pyridoxine 5-phosphate synthase